MNSYTIQSTPEAPPMAGTWEMPVWQRAKSLTISHFYPPSSAHRPHTQARLLYDSQGIYGLYQVQDQFVRCLHPENMQEVWQDACVEFFVQPKAEHGYFNFEFNCGGALLCTFIIDATPVPGGFADYQRLTAPDLAQVNIHPSLPAFIDPEITEPVRWTLQFFIPFALLEKYVGELGQISGQVWRGNFYKCAENNSHPHWASWNPLPGLGFHQPQYFGEIHLSDDQNE